MSTHSIRRVVATGIHGRFDYECSFNDGVNIVYGKNGTGKTTLIHILVNLLNRDFDRFAALQFHSIRVEMSDGHTYKITQDRKPHRDAFLVDIFLNDEKQNEKPINSALMEREEPERLRDQFRRQLRDVSTTEQLVLLKELSRETKTNNDTPIASVAYFPAFRAAIDAWSVGQDEERSRRYLRSESVKWARIEKTQFARNLFGPFVPLIEYPSTTEIEYQLNDRIRRGIAQVAAADRTFFSEIPNRILQLLAESSTESTDLREMLNEIRALSQRFQEYPIQVQSGGILDQLNQVVLGLSGDARDRKVAAIVLIAYREALRKIVEVQEKNFNPIDRLLSAVNDFFEGKRIVIVSPGGALPNPSSLSIKFTDDVVSQSHVGEALSSGERQILTLIYATSQMAQRDVVLIDEPELSLHVDWQRKLIPSMEKQIPTQQLIVFSHSPVIGSKYKAKLIELKPRKTTVVEANREMDPDLEDEDAQNDIPF